MTQIKSIFRFKSSILILPILLVMSCEKSFESLSSEGISSIVAGDFNTCAVIEGAAKCWGDNSSGQLGNVSKEPSEVPLLVTGLATGAQMVDISSGHSCVLVNGGIKCWGMNVTGQLGNGSKVDSWIPVSVKGL